MSQTLKGTELLQFLQDQKPEDLSKVLEDIHPADILDALEVYDGDPIQFLSQLPTDVLAAIIEEAEEEDKTELFDLFSMDQKKEIIGEMASDELADLLGNIDPEEANDLIDSMDDEDAKEVIELLQYHPETAGGIMATEFVAITDNMTVRQTLEYLQENGDEAESLSYLYVLDQNHALRGVVSLRDIVVSRFDEAIDKNINTHVITVTPEVDQEEVGRIVKKYGFSSIPVVDANHKMLGIITADDVLDIVVDENTEDFEKMAALAHNEAEYLETGVFGLARRRLFWLLFLMVSATFTSFIIQGYEHSLASVVILAAFIPMLMDTGGNAGSQSATLIIRGMALGEIAIKDYMVVFFKEFRVSLIVGFALAVVNFFRIWAFNRDVALAFTVSAALLFTIVLAKAVGCTLPMVARKLKIDPAIMAAPIITTIVDALSLIVYFKLAGMFYI
ncbi:MAG: magnesium transporter [Candidatus Cloacimonadaceae bacterium]|nr:magnesium transporter [Candidatus Cloacimonadaceae bacterium]